MAERQPLRQLRTGLSLVRARYVLLLVMGITLCYGMYSEGFDRLWTKHLLDHFTLPAIGTLPIIIWWGILRGVSSILAILLAEYARRRPQMNNGARGIWLLLGITAGISLGMFFYANIRWLGLALLAYICIEALRTLYVPLFFAWVNGFLKSEVRATVISLISQLDAVGQIAGGPLIGYAGLALVHAAGDSAAARSCSRQLSGSTRASAARKWAHPRTAEVQTPLAILSARLHAVYDTI